MDALGIPFQYEKEGFELNGVRYLPDFYLPKLKAWIEVKGTETSQEERNKAESLCATTKENVYIFIGPPSHEWISGAQSAEVIRLPCEWTDCQVSYDDGHEWCECAECGCVEIQFGGKAERNSCHHNSGLYRSPRLEAAFFSAMRERFGT